MKDDAFLLYLLYEQVLFLSSTAITLSLSFSLWLMIGHYLYILLFLFLYLAFTSLFLSLQKSLFNYVSSPPDRIKRENCLYMSFWGRLYARIDVLRLPYIFFLTIKMDRWWQITVSSVGKLYMLFYKLWHTMIDIS
jgi:hypothetical protein